VADAPRLRVSTEQWDELYGELLLRLEQTPRQKALEVPFADKKTADSARSALWNRLRRDGRQSAMEFTLRKTTLYVRRGPHWSK
jgi:hypothetical protein